MNELTIVNKDGAAVIDSREVAAWVEKNHKDLMRDIRGYVDCMEGERKIAPSEFFLESTYVSEQNKTLPCYLVTRKGCEMVANKLTGQKGVLFTAAYIEKFHEYEEKLKRPMSPTDLLELQVKALREIENRQDEQTKAIAATNARIDSIKDAVTLNTQSWREDCRKLIVRIARNMGGYEYIKDVHAEIFKLVDQRGGVSLSIRLANKRARMAAEGVCKSKRDKLTKVDIIADDKKLIEIYTAIVKEMAVKELDGETA